MPFAASCFSKALYFSPFFRLTVDPSLSNKAWPVLLQRTRIQLRVQFRRHHESPDSPVDSSSHSLMAFGYCASNLSLGIRSVMMQRFWSE